MTNNEALSILPYHLEYPASLGIDWLSRSYPVASMSQGMALGADRQRLRQLTKSEGEKTASLYGYVGVRLGGCFVGRIQEGSRARRLEILSGKYAKDADIIPSKGGLKVNRIDLQATLLLDEDAFYSIKDASNRVNKEIERILSHVRLFKEVNGRKLSWLNRLKVTTIKGDGEEDGMTLYIGSRSSECFIRIYNKTAESRVVAPNTTVPALLRVEAELKDSYAESAYSYLEDCGSFTEQQGLASLLNEYISRVGVSISAVPIYAPWLKRVTNTRNTDRTLAWLSNTVRPAIERMFLTVGVDVVAEALGKTVVFQLGLFGEGEHGILDDTDGSQ